MSAVQALADMATITFREQQLLKAYRAADDRGKHAIDELARHEATYCRRPSPKPQDSVVMLRH